MTQPFDVEDINRYRRITEVTANATAAVCAVQSVDDANDTYTSALWLVPLDGSPSQLTAGTWIDEYPRWSPDGRQLAFLSDRAGGAPQVHLIDPAGGEARSLTSLDQGVVMFDWHPSGKRLLATTRVLVDPEARGSAGRERKPRGDAPEVAWRLPYKADGLGFTLGREIHLLVIDIDTGETTRLTHGSFDVRSAAWSPDGARIAYARTREGRLAHRTDVWIMDADGTHARQLSHDVASVEFPTWSPDGRRIAFAGSGPEGDALVRLWLADVESGEVCPLGSEDLEVDSGDTVHWSDDGSELYLVQAHRGTHRVAAVTVPGGAMRAITTGRRQVGALQRAGKRFVFTSCGVADPMELHAAGADGGDERRLTDFNGWWRERQQPDVEQRTFQVPDGKGGTEDVLGWLILPKDRRGPVPLLVYLHGGPASHVLLDYPWHPYWNVLWSRGWGLLALDAVGSSSYGRRFATRLRGHWGELDLEQHLSAIGTLRTEGVTDERVAVTGKSYGGYLSAWAIGQCNEFRAAVVAAPISNLESHYATSDSGYYADAYSMKGDAVDEEERNRRLSPIRYAKESVTPTLILQGKEDQRCPLGQAEELFTVLMRCGDTQAELVMYPGADHHFYETGKPSARRDAAERLVGWVERWVGTER